MFDIGFWELLVIGVVALLVIGPDKLPGLARTAGLWIGRARHFVGTVKADIDRELRADELRRALERDAGLDELKQIMNSTRDEIQDSTNPDYLLKSSGSEPANEAAEDEPAANEPAANQTPDADAVTSLGTSRQPQSGKETRRGTRDNTHEQERD